MTFSNDTIFPEMNAKETVLSLVKALNEEDFKTARTFVSDPFTFEGVLGSRNGLDAYFRDMEKMRLKYNIKKVFADDEDVCLLYELNISGKTIFCCGWYHTEGGKVTSLRVVFDPRPILETSAGK